MWLLSVDYLFLIFILQFHKEESYDQIKKWYSGLCRKAVGNGFASTHCILISLAAESYKKHLPSKIINVDIYITQIAYCRTALEDLNSISLELLVAYFFIVPHRRNGKHLFHFWFTIESNPAVIAT